ncbi:hypothetical protein ACFWNF_15990 [Streptomyces anulatus]|uniref:hypothetical protein n=1 Tax=Streptomyces anulatus TaxID=1892 RepID=UPI00365C6702
MKRTARSITARAIDMSDDASTSWVREMYGTRFYFERYEPFTTESGERVSGYLHAYRYNAAMEFYELTHSWNIPA